VFAYAISLMQATRRLQPFFVDLEIDDAPRWSAAVYQVSIGNGRYHGGGLTVAEDAAIDDGKVDLYVVHPGTFWQLFACLTHLRFGLMKKPKVLDRHTAVKVTLTTPRPRSRRRRQARHKDAGGVHPQAQGSQGRCAAQAAEEPSRSGADEPGISRARSPAPTE
jgi:hypothetical protein